MRPLRRRGRSRARLPVIDDASLARLQQLDQVSRAASAKLQGAAVNIVVHLKQDALIDGMLRAAGETIQIHVVDNQRISIGDLADVEIRPGGGELERLRTRRGRCRLRSWRRHCAPRVSKILSRAVEIHDERVACEQQITELGKQVKATSSKSLAQLREDLAVCVAELERLGPAGATAPRGSGSGHERAQCRACRAGRIPGQHDRVAHAASRLFVASASASSGSTQSVRRQRNCRRRWMPPSPSGSVQPGR